jgi:hypothetical protein
MPPFSTRKRVSPHSETFLLDKTRIDAARSNTSKELSRELQLLPPGELLLRDLAIQSKEAGRKNLNLITK